MHSHSPLPPPRTAVLSTRGKQKLIKIAIIKKIYSLHFLWVYYSGVFCTRPHSSLYLHSDMEGLVLGSLALLARRGEFQAHLSKFFSLFSVFLAALCKPGQGEGGAVWKVSRVLLPSRPSPGETAGSTCPLRSCCF